MALQLVTSAGTFGPFTSIITESDHYDCDGSLIYFEVVGGTGTIEQYIPSQESLDKAARRLGTIEAEEEYAKSIDSSRDSVIGLNDSRLRDVIGVIYAEAKAYQANNSVTTPAIQKLSDVWGVTRGQAVARVVGKYGSYIANIAESFALREDKIDSLP
jgi:hypothetical protein